MQSLKKIQTPRISYRGQRDQTAGQTRRIKLKAQNLFGVFEDFGVGGVGVVDGEADKGGDFVEALLSGGAGVDVQQAVFLVVYHLEDVAVAADEDVGPRQLDLSAQGRRIVPRPAADVHHQHTGALAFEEIDLRQAEVQVEAVAVAPHGADGFELAQLVQYSVADVASVPQLVAVLEEGEDLRCQCAVSVGENTNALHSLACIS